MSAQAEPGNPLKQLEYKTLEQRVRDLEKARAQAQQLIAPLTPEQQKVAAKVAEKLAMLLGWSIKKSHKKFEVPHKVHKVRPERRSTLVG